MKSWVWYRVDQAIPVEQLSLEAMGILESGERSSKE